MTAGEPRHYLMCRPTYFTVDYEINPWMDRSQPVDTRRAINQWEHLRDTFRDLGHTADVIDALPDLPDMVFAANGAAVIDGLVYAARFRHPERAGEAPAYLRWLAAHGYRTAPATHINEGQGDFLDTGSTIVAGYGFRTEHAAHTEAGALWGRPVLSLELVDPRFYHLDTALTVLAPADPANGRNADLAYYPAAFSDVAQRLLAHAFPDAIRATPADAGVLGLNAVSDGRHVVLSPQATRLADALRERGYEPVPVDTSELLRGGGGAKCCTLDLGKILVNPPRTARWSVESEGDSRRKRRRRRPTARSRPVP